MDISTTDSRSPGLTRKLPFDIDSVLRRIEKAIKPFAKAAMFDLKERGYGTVFQQLIACMISIRTRDEVSLGLALTLLEKAPDPESLLKLSAQEIAGIIRQSSFAYQKAERLREIARIALEKYGGELPVEPVLLQELPGIGPKCAHLALGVAAGVPVISVDIHVHRVTNRWGYVQASTPERTMKQLEEVLPERHWIDINRLLVPFGKHVCTGSRPYCSRCPVLNYCRQVGVRNPR